MTLKSATKLFATWGLVLAVCLTFGFPLAAWSGTLRISMKDGTAVEVPYYWESEGQIKFEIAGGVAGVSKSQVSSVVEILDAKEFDPELIFQAPTGMSSDNRTLLQNLIESKVGEKCELKEPQENIEILRAAAEAAAPARGTSIEAVIGQKLSVEKSLPVVCPGPTGPMIVIQDILNSKAELKNKRFELVLYDTDGNVLQRKSCEVYPLNLEPDTQRKLNMRGRLYLVRAAIKPDAKIKRYEIAATQ